MPFSETLLYFEKNILPYLLFIFITVTSLHYSNKLSFKELMLNDKSFLMWVVLITVFTSYVLRKKTILSDEKENKRLRRATKKAYIAMIIAYLAHLELIIPPFFLVLFFSFISDV